MDKKKKTIIAVSAAAAAFAITAGVIFLNKPKEPVVEVTPEVTEATTLPATAPVTEAETEPVTTYEPFSNGLCLKAQEYHG